MIASLLLATATPAAAPPPDPAQVAMKKADEAFQQGRYLEAIDRYRAAAFTPDGRVKDDFAMQMWEQTSPYITKTPDPVIEWRMGRSNHAPAAALPTLLVAQPADALDAIVARARQTRIVILNEAHSEPRSRAFGLEVAQALRPLGFTYLAAETFDNSLPRPNVEPATAALEKDGFVRRGSGWYTRDPVFASFVGQALALGYRPISYEQTQAQSGGKGRGQIPIREQAQADNLVAALAKLPADAKLLIYVGYSHVAEAPLKDGGKRKTEWMATRLKRMTGIDPLTIDQTTLMGVVLPAMASYPFGERSAVLMQDGKPLVLGPYAGAIDLQAIHPPARWQGGRPTWLTLMAGTPTAIPFALLPAHGRRLIQAFAADAPADAIPLDQVIVTAGMPAPPLMLPPGPVRYATEYPIALP